MFWNIYILVSSIAVLLQLVFMMQTYKNYTYALKKAKKNDFSYKPVALVTIPCKGIDSAFEKNITSILQLDYENFYLHFVVEDTSDPAYESLSQLKETFGAVSKARDIRILVAGQGSGCSQKIHNLLHSCQNAPADVEVFAFADSDACLKPRWLASIVHPLRKQKAGVSTGYRWFIPQRNNLASLGLSAINAKIAQLLGNTIFNQAWGGSMAIRVETFYETGIDKIWETAIADDLSVSYAVKKHKMKVVFVPGCLVASYESTTWLKFLEFARRQFLITRVTIPTTWYFAFFSNLYSLLGLWAGTAIGIYAALSNHVFWPSFFIMPIVFFAAQICRSILRQKMIKELLPEDAGRMRPAMLADVIGACIWSWVLFICILSSAFGRTITWRNIHYRLISPTKTVVLPPKTK
jgi:cellulose synthase/poly-beta-1,6-N-acetylglucosamine synthase-like glycosyltransferase